MTKSGYELLKDPFLNKGTAFTQAERKAYQLEGLLPPAVETIELQAERVYAEMKKKSSLIEERRFLMDVFNHNRTLFYYVFREHLVELMPIVYDPVLRSTASSLWTRRMPAISRLTVRMRSRLPSEALRKAERYA